MTAFNGYPLSIALALLLHGLIIGAVLWMQRANTEVPEIVQPPSVQATLVEQNPQERNERVQQQRQQQQEQQRREEQRREEERRAEEQRQAELEAQRERERQQAEQRAREEEQQRRQEEERRQRELQEQRERERQEAEQRRQEEQRRREQEARRQEEEAARQAAAEQAAREQAETDAEVVGAYTAIIHDLVQQNWSRPPSARNDMTAVLRIQLVPTGEVVDVQIVQSSGDAAFDRAAENAVLAVGRFSELQGMPPRLFERNFRSLLLTFRPEDLRN
ncbi:MAG: energy transducer TonB [Pseudomonadota bacterium]